MDCHYSWKDESFLAVQNLYYVVCNLLAVRIPQPQSRLVPITVPRLCYIYYVVHGSAALGVGRVWEKGTMGRFSGFPRSWHRMYIKRQTASMVVNCV